MRQRQPLGGALGHGADPTARMGRGRSALRRRTDPQRWSLHPERSPASESGELEKVVTKGIG